MGTLLAQSRAQGEVLPRKRAHTPPVATLLLPGSEDKASPVFAAVLSPEKGSFICPTLVRAQHTEDKGHMYRHWTHFRFFELLVFRV